jgi:hypothetical protein
MIPELDELYHPRRVVLSEFGDGVLRAIVTCITQSYAQAYDACYQDYAKDEAHDLLPYIRRAEIHRRLQDALWPYPHVRVTSQATEHHNSHHLCIETDRVLLTLSKVRSPGEMVHRAAYREQYARDSQLDFFQQDNEVILRGRLYAVGLHGHDPLYRERLAFLRIVFPDQAFTHYHDESIDLLQRFPDLATWDEPEHIPQEPISKPPPMTLKTTPKTEEVAS